MKINTNFTTPKLCTRKNDLRKDWFVYFYFTDPQTRKKELCRYKLGINYYKTKKERESEGETIKSELLNKLKAGWNPITNDVVKVSNQMTIAEALGFALKIKKPVLTFNSNKTYKDQVAILLQFINAKKLGDLYAHNFTGELAQAHLDHLLVDKGYVGVTHNNHLTTMHSLFAVLKDRKIIASNPYSGIKKAREEVGKNTTYSNSEENKFINFIEKKNFGFYLATRFVKYCFLRRTELHGLQVKHIRWDNKTIVIPSETAKSRFQDSVTIPKTLEDVICKSGLLDLPQDYYIFGARFKPGVNKIATDISFTSKQKDINKILGIKPECSFYSWKHTGAVELYNLTKDPYVVMRQCRHADIKTTMRYLRALGCGVSEHVRGW